MGSHTGGELSLGDPGKLAGLIDQRSYIHGENYDRSAMTNSAFRYDGSVLFTKVEGHQTRLADKRDLPELNCAGQLQQSQVEDVDLHIAL